MVAVGALQNNTTLATQLRESCIEVLSGKNESIISVGNSQYFWKKCRDYHNYISMAR